MVFLDSSAIIRYLGGDTEVRDHIEGREPWWSSTICVFEVIQARLGSGSTDMQSVRREFSGVHALELNESIALEAARLQDELMNHGDRLATADLLIAATARTTGDELVVADSDFETDALEDLMQVTNFGN